MNASSYGFRVRVLLQQRYGISARRLDQLDAELRRKITEEDRILPERLDAAVEQVMAALFRTLSH
jgi:hypothetical protein